jgi:hypothetical protein
MILTPEQGKLDLILDKMAPGNLFQKQATSGLDPLKKVNEDKNINWKKWSVEALDPRSGLPGSYSLAARG